MLSPGDLDAIAGADFAGEFPAHREALEALRVGRREVLAPMGWNPREALALTRWSKPSRDNLAGHRQRAFACVGLLVAASLPEDEGRTVSLNETTAAAVDSLWITAPDEAPALVALLELLIALPGFASEAAHLALGKFLLLEAKGASASGLVAALDEADRLASDFRSLDFSMASPPRGRFGWVFGLTSYNQHRSLWLDLLDQAIARLKTKAACAVVIDRMEALAQRTD